MKIKSFFAAILIVFLLCPCSFSGQKKTPRKAPTPATTSTPAPAVSISDDKARSMVKEIPSVDIPATISRWKLQESELAKLRGWADLLVQAPDGPGFQPRWSEFATQIKGKNLTVQSQDVVGLIQMILSRAYDSANQDLEKCRKRVEFYSNANQQMRDNLTDARKIQGLLRSHQQEPWAGSLLPLPANLRSLRKCQVSSGEELKLSCQDVLVSTTTELDDYVNQVEVRAEEFEKMAAQAAADVEVLSDKRVKKLVALSETAKMMYETAASLLGVQ